MSPLETIEEFLRACQRRRALWTGVCAAAIFAGALALATALAVWIGNARAYPPREVFWLGLSLHGLAVGGLVVCVSLVWKRSRRQAVSGALEGRHRHLDHALRTYLDAAAAAERTPLLWLLADDLVARLDRVPERGRWPRRRSWLAIGAVAAGLAEGALLIPKDAALRAASSRLWALGAGFAPPSFRVTPERIQLLRGSDLVVTGAAVEFAPSQATIYVREPARAREDSASMRPLGSGRFEFRFSSVQAPFAFRIAAGEVSSTLQRVVVLEPPKLAAVTLRVTPPDWTGRPMRELEELSGLRVYPGTRAGFEIEIEGRADRVLLDFRATPDSEVEPAVQRQPEQSSATVELVAGEGGLLRGELLVDRSGSYRMWAELAGERIALTESFTVELLEDRAPEVAIVKPGRDAKATAIEEVTIRIEASDDVRIEGLELHYAVNGNEPLRHVFPIPSIPGELADVEATLEREVVLELEELEGGGLRPGDVVSIFARANDRTRKVETELFFIEVRPFRMSYTQSQQAPGGESGLGPDALSQRQREIVSATWNVSRQKSAERTDEWRDRVDLLTRLQARLRQQADTLRERMAARMQGTGDSEGRAILRELEQAAGAMVRAHDHLEAVELEAALGPEREALRRLLRIEAQARERQVSMQMDPQAGGDRFSQDLSELVELEMDPKKNVYELPEQIREESSGELGVSDEDLEELRRLAERQQQLEEEARSRSLPATPQRWRQESLAREAEALKGRLERRSDPRSQSMARSLAEVIESLRAPSASDANASAGSTSPSQTLSDLVRSAERDRSDQLRASLDALPERADAILREQRASARELRDELPSRLWRSESEGAFTLPGVGVEAQQVRERRELRERIAELRREAEAMARLTGPDSPVAARRLEEAAAAIRDGRLTERMAYAEELIESGEAAFVLPIDEQVGEGLEAVRDAIRDAVRVARTLPASLEPNEREQLQREVARLRRRVAAELRGMSESDVPFAELETRADERQETRRELRSLAERLESAEIELSDDLREALDGVGREATADKVGRESEHMWTPALAMLEELELQLSVEGAASERAELQTFGVSPSARSEAPLEEYFLRLSRDRATTSD